MILSLKKLFLFILTPLFLGGIVGFLTVPNSNIDSIIPPFIFPIVWTILYIFMGISSYIIFEKINKISLIYVIQLIINLLWSFIFFKFKLFVLSFIWIIVLIMFVVIMIRGFFNEDKLAGYLQIPYLIWLFISLFISSTFII